MSASAIATRRASGIRCRRLYACCLPIVPTPSTPTPSFAMRLLLLLLVLDGHGAALLHCPINRVNNNDVPQSLLPPPFRLSALFDTLGKFVDFQNELVHRLEGLVEPFSFDLAAKPPFFFERERRPQFSPTFFSVHVNERGKRRAVSRGALQHESAFEIEPEGDALLHLSIPSFIANPADAAGRNWVFVQQPAGCVHAVHAQIRQRSSTTQLLRKQPGGGVVSIRTEFCKQCVDDVDSAQLACRDHFLQRQAARLKILSIGGHEQYFMATASIDHVAGLLNRGRQRLFADHMLAGLRRGHCIFLVFARWSRDIDGINPRILQTLGELVIAASLFGTKLSRILRGLFFVATH